MACLVLLFEHIAKLEAEEQTVPRREEYRVLKHENCGSEAGNCFGDGSGSVFYEHKDALEPLEIWPGFFLIFYWFGFVTRLLIWVQYFLKLGLSVRYQRTDFSSPDVDPGPTFIWNQWPINIFIIWISIAMAKVEIK